MSDIPSELHREILALAPAVSVVRFRSVCKEWRRLIDDPFFIKSHTNNQSSSINTLLIRTYGDIRTYGPGTEGLYFLSLDSLNLTDDRQTIDLTPVQRLTYRGGTRLPVSRVASCACNGLILMTDFYSRNDIWLIWNPLTRQRHELPPIPLDAGNTLHLKGSGIGFDYAADDYKIVRIDSLSHDLTVHQTRIYSLKSDSWRIISDWTYGSTLHSNEGVFLKGSLHWVSWDGITVLDLGTEDYHQLPLPRIPIRDDLSKLHLEALSGCLFLSHRTRNFYEAWVMNEYGVEKSWTKLFSIKSPELTHARPVAYFKREKHVLMQYNRGFIWVDIENASVKKVTVSGVNGISFCHLCPGSLFPLGNK